MKEEEYIEEYVEEEVPKVYKELVYIGEGVISIMGYNSLQGKRKLKFRDHIIVPEKVAQDLINSDVFVEYKQEEEDIKFDESIFDESNNNEQMEV
ncbi:MAG: hypothetical protein ACTSPI_03345 [Candidatus Heimdallarchaeaceae archaeon]